MKSLLNIKKSTQKLREQNKTIEIPAFLGDLSGVVKADKNNSVYVVLFNGEVQVVRNDKVPPIPRLPVIIGNDTKDSTLRVLRLRESFSNPPYVNLPAHADKTHQWPQVDTLWVRPEQFLSGIAIPGSGMIVQFIGFVYYLNGWHLLNTQPIDFTSYIPTSGANYVLVQVDATKTISFVEGTSKPSRETLEYADIPVPTVGQKPLFAVKMYKGQTRIIKAKSTSDIIDLRFAGFASGGEASVIDWSDILNVPLVFPPDLTITDAVYPRKWLKSAAPTVDDDIDGGYSKSDIWIDQSNGDAYICIDNADGVADWLKVSSSAGGVTSFIVEGRLAVVDNAADVILITSPTSITSWMMYLESLGSSGSTIIDVILKRVGDADISIFDGGTLPEIAYDDADHLLIATPTIIDFLAGDVLALNIEQIAPSASQLTFAAISGGSGSGGLGLTVTDGVTTVNNVGQIIIEGGTVIDEGGGQVKIGKTGFDFIEIRDELPNGTEGGANIDLVWTTMRFNTLTSDSGGHCSLVGNQFTLDAGTYEFEIEHFFYEVSACALRLWNVSDDLLIKNGVSDYASHGTVCEVNGKFQIANTKTLEVQYIAQYVQASYGLGVSVGNRTSEYADAEIYGAIRLWKVA